MIDVAFPPSTGRALRAAALVEGTTLLLLVGLAVPLRHLGGLRAATAVMGPVHGLAFLAYGWCVAAAAAAGEVTRRQAVALALGALVPFGGFVAALRCRRGGAAL